MQDRVVDHREQRQGNKKRQQQQQKQGLGIRALILCPTRELATQIGSVVDSLSSFWDIDAKTPLKLNSLVITGGVRREDQIIRLADSVARGEIIDVVIATPGRLVDVLTQYNPELRQRVNRKSRNNGNAAAADDNDDDDEDDDERDDDDEDRFIDATDAALERRLLQALDANEKDTLSLEQIQTLQLDRKDDEGRQALEGLLAQGLQYLVLDEADRLLGRAFEAEVNAVLELLGHNNNQNKKNDRIVETWLFSATFPKLIEPRVEAVLKHLGQTTTTRISCANSDRLASDQEEVSATLQKKLDHTRQQDQNRNVLAQLGPASTINLRTIRMKQRDRTQVLKNLWLQNEEEWSRGGALVFVSTRYSAEHVSLKLRRAGIRSSELHGKLDQDARIRRLQDLQSGKTHILLATDLASRGLDVVGLSAVVNYDLPRSTADFVHRVGRTGRAGRRGEAITFVTPQTEAHFDLIEKRHIPEPSEREVMPGFEVDEEKWTIQAQSTTIRAPGAGHSAKDLAHDRMFGGIKGKRRSKKDLLREKAAQDGAIKESLR